jgi:hypothetical protein
MCMSDVEKANLLVSVVVIFVYIRRSEQIFGFSDQGLTARWGYVNMSTGGLMFFGTLCSGIG